ncbi:nicotinate-nucleotide adenylyltransferase [Thermomonas sp.]|uniref:nicotinate-nucleotide adenylyltransferase n=1 Tax=Thermomonas sp. TaxID=1971895 RepID=UPI00248A2D98|nr:nicotinate-nucleotide adenylyltransferase [Thermomonas sp.]MDI1252075.1 nicotinate-nucleotide adenylyltransferase [Thermomonas sp.]
MTDSTMRVCYGGTFDPVHNGHLAVARTVRDALSAQFALLPAHDPPHKGPTRADALQRAEMLDLAVNGEPGLCVDRRELGREGPSWTVDTLAELRNEHGNDVPIAWLIGADSLLQLASWHRWRELFELAHILVVDRPGAAVDADALRLQAPEVFAEIAPRWRDPGQLADAPHGGFACVPMPALRPESSTELRRRIRDGEPWQDWVPPAVAAYIVHHGLYQPAAGIISASSTSDRP